MLFLDDDRSLHFPMAKAAENGTFEWERAGLFRRELDDRGFAFFKFLLDVKSIDLDSMVVISRRNRELDGLAFLDPDRVGRELVFLGRHLNLLYL